jgi:peptidoglycan/LPS O-acetylase OafA/YrhL
MKNDQFLVKIHGLRGVSILLVLFFHFYESIFRGGYLGVDIFFVISGYIVTKSSGRIWPHEKKDIFRFLKTFYVNRIARLLPVGILVSSVSLLLGLLFNSLSNSESLVEFYGASLLGFANVLLFITQSSYFSLSHEFNFFTQTWSLGVEEQFYVLYSLLICLLPFLKGKIVRVFAIISILSFASNLNSLRFVTHEAHFFLTPFRLWEMSLGVLLYLKQSEIKNRLQVYAKYFEIYTPLALIAAFFIKYSPNSFPFPILIIIFPAVCYIIVFSDEEKTTLTDCILKSRMLNFLGTISYSLYLIHWPVLVFTKYAFGKGLLQMTIAMVLSISLSFLITKYYEVPLNKMVRAKGKHALVVFLITFSFILGSSYFKTKNPFYIANPLDTEQMQWKQDFEGCIETSKDITARVKNCFSPKRLNNENVIFVAGDSHAGQIALMLRKFAEKNNHEVKLMHSGDKANSIHTITTDEWKSRPVIFEEMLKHSRPLDLVIMTFASYHFEKADSKDLEKAFEVWGEYIKRYLAKGIKVILVIDSPYYPNYPIESCVFDSKFKSNSRCELSREEYLKQRLKQVSFFKRLKRQQPEIYIWDMIDEFCQDNCSSIVNGELTYFDYNHLSRKRAMELESSFERFYNNELRKSP